MLSGTGADGTEGLKAVKKRGGFVIVQDPSEAAFDGMPKSAIKTGQADRTLPVAGIPAALVNRASIIHVQPSAAKPASNGEIENGFLEVLDLVRQKTNQDFSLYKTGTLERRIERRMAMAGIADVARYVERLKSDPAELDSLGHDLLINVTEFFRDPAAFEALSASVIPDMVREQPLTGRCAFGCRVAAPARKSIRSPCFFWKRSRLRSATSSFRSLHPMSMPIPSRLPALASMDLKPRLEWARSAWPGFFRGKAKDTGWCAICAKPWCSRSRTSSPIRRSRGSISFPAGTF